MTDSDMQLIRLNTNRLCDSAYDTLWKACYLAEAAKRMPLGDVAQSALTQARRELMEICGGEG